MNTTEEKITEDLLRDTFGITVKSEFIPWSKSRNFDPAKHTYVINKGGNEKTELKVSEGSLNWKITLCKDGRDIITTDYSAGIGHAPAYKNYNVKVHGCKMSMCHATFLEEEIEKGFECESACAWVRPTKKRILPETPDVVWSLLQYGYAIDSPTYEDWADEYGYDRDSRKGEETYRICLEIGLKLRAALGDKMLAELRELFADF